MGDIMMTQEQIKLYSYLANSTREDIKEAYDAMLHHTNEARLLLNVIAVVVSEGRTDSFEYGVLRASFLSHEKDAAQWRERLDNIVSNA
jgi:hypothetical protein